MYVPVAAAIIGAGLVCFRAHIKPPPPHQSALDLNEL
jgi:hypothetical protein